MKAKRLLALLLAVAMMFTMAPATLALSVETNSIQGTGEDASITYNFYNNGALIETQIIKSTDKLVEPAIPEGTGEFLGWFVNGEQLDFEEDFEEGVSGPSEVSVQAMFAPTAYVTFYDADGKTIAATKKVVKGSVTTTDVTAQPTQSGQVFSGWKDANDTPVGDTYSTDGSASLYPVFVAGHSLTFITNQPGETGATEIAIQYVKAGEATKAPDAPQRPGYTFDGWYMKDSTEFDFGNALNSDTTVYAHWTPAAAKYTVIIWKQTLADDYDAADDDKTYDYESSEARDSTTGTLVSVAAADKTKNYTGFHLGRYDAAKAVEADGSTILNVYYDRNINTITFWSQRQGGQRAIIDKYTGLYQQNFSKYGYTWLSNYRWTEQDSGGTGQTFLNSFSVEEQDYNLYAQEEPGKKNIYHYIEKVDSMNSSDVNNYILGGEAKGSASTFNFNNKFTGFTVYGYRKSSSGSMTVLNTTSTSYNSILYVYHQRNTYNIDFYNGNTIVKTVGKKYEAPLSVNDAPSGLTYPGNSQDAAHYTFGGWFANPECTVVFDFSATMPANNLIAYAKWTPEQVTVTYDANGGKIDVDGTKVDKASETINYNGKASGATATWDGHKFLGWVDTNNNPWNFESPVTADMTLKATWRSENALKVAYDVSGVTDSNNYVDGAQAIAATYTYDESETEGDGKRFIGWQLGETIYYPGDVITVDFANNELDGNPSDDTVTLKAVYSTVFRIYHTNGTKETVSYPTGTYDITDRTRSGYLYGGYYKREGVEFDGSSIVKWTATKADGTLDESLVYTESGLSMKPSAGTIYYLKEVSNVYLRPRIYYTYDEVDTEYPLTRIYTVTAVDDGNYRLVGFDIDENSMYEDNDVYTSVTFKKKSGKLMKDPPYTVSNTFLDISITSGYLYLARHYDIAEGTDPADWAAFTIHPYFVTPDGVKVTGNEIRTYDPQDGVAPGGKSEKQPLKYNKPSNIAPANITCEPYDDGISGNALSLTAINACSLEWDAETSTDPDISEEETETPSEITITTVIGGIPAEWSTDAGDCTGIVPDPSGKQDGEVFVGWFTEDGEAADLSDVQEDLTIYAKYIPAKSVRLNVTTSKGRGGIVNVTASLNLPGAKVAEVGFLTDDGYELADAYKGSSYRASWTTSASSNTVTVTPYWVTLDGTTVYGEPGTYRIRTNNSSLWGF